MKLIQLWKVPRRADQFTQEYWEIITGPTLPGGRTREVNFTQLKPPPLPGGRVMGAMEHPQQKLFSKLVKLPAFDLRCVACMELIPPVCFLG